MSNRNRRNRKKKVNKASYTPTPNNTTNQQRENKRRISTTGINYLRREVERLMPNELSAANRLFTYELMLQDPDIFTAYDTTRKRVEQAFGRYEVEYNKESEESKKAREFMIYCIEKLFPRGMTVRSIAGLAFDYTKNKLSLFEKDVCKIKDSNSEFDGLYGLEGLHKIDLRTLDTTYPFKTKSHGRGLEYARQRPETFVDNINLRRPILPNTKDGYVHINCSRLAFFTDSGEINNPFGISIFDSIYSEWRFKTLTKQILLTGIGKDLAGTPIFTVPEEVIANAEDDPDSSDAALIKTLDDSAARMHTGDQSFVRLPSDTYDGGNTKMFDLKFLGVEGGGKAFDLTAILEQSRKIIFGAFGAQSLITGENGGGSYSLAETQANSHAQTVSANVAIIEEVWNKDIWPYIFKYNGWNLSPEDMPKLKANGFENSMDENGKYGQRLASVGMLPAVPEVINHFLSTAEIPYQVPKDMPVEELAKLLPANTSGAGKGKGTSGTGNSQAGRGDGVENVG